MINTTLEFAYAALDTLRAVPDENFEFEYCSIYEECGCAVHWMFRTGVLPAEPYWDALTGLRLCPPELRTILGFNSEESRELYDVPHLRDVTKAQVMQQLEEYINANS